MPFDKLSAPFDRPGAQLLMPFDRLRAQLLANYTLNRNSTTSRTNPVSFL